MSQRGQINDCPLTAAQLRAVQGVADGLTYKQIAYRSDRSVSTIRSHLHSAMQALGVCNSTQAVLKCARAGWIDLAREDLPDGSVRLERVMARLALETEKLVDALFKRRELTRVQARYLAAFDEVLFARTAEQTAEARDKMDRALISVLADARIQIRDRQRGDLAEVLIRLGTRGLEAS